MTVSVLFVCLGNICRSPTAHGIVDAMLAQRGLDKRIVTDSAGTGDWHIGRPPDTRMQAAAKARGYDLSYLRARQVCADDFHQFDHILAMDEANYRDLEAMRPANSKADLRLFLSYARQSELMEVPDPYYGGEAGFYQVIDLVEDAAAGLLDALAEQHAL